MSPARLHDDVLVPIGPTRLTIDVAAVRWGVIDVAGTRPDVPVERVEDGPALLERRPLRLSGIDRVESLVAGSRSPPVLASLCVHALTLQLKERFSYLPPADGDQQGKSRTRSLSPVEPIPGAFEEAFSTRGRARNQIELTAGGVAELPSRATHRPLERSLR